MAGAHGFRRSSSLIAAAFVLVSGPVALAQTPYLVADIHPGSETQGSGTRLPMVVGSRLFLFSCDAYRGCEPWTSDGTEAGTAMVKDVFPGSGSSLGYDWAFSFTGAETTAFFPADDGVHGRELWRSDGTEAGTQLVKDLCPGSCSPFGVYTVPAAAVGGTLFFVAREHELWRSDGTEPGTVLVKDVVPGGGGVVRGLKNVGGTLFFWASSGLWKSDGTAQGTVQVTALPAGAERSALVDVNGTVFFGAGGALWRSNGTEASTFLLRQINPGPNPPSPVELTNLQGMLLFVADDGVRGRALWKSDGTSLGTMIVKDIDPGTGYSVYPSGLTVVGPTVFFIGDDVAHGPELWKSDGTSEGTVMVRDILPGPDSSNPGPFADVNGTLFFATSSWWEGHQLWTSQGTAASTVPVRSFSSGFSYFMTNMAGTAYFDAAGGMLWKSDGTAAGTVVVKDPGRRPAGSRIESVASMNGTLFFGADDGVHGRSLWKSDGGPRGTVLVKNVAPVQGPYVPGPGRDFTVVGSTLFFIGSDGVHGGELWKSDGTEAGTVMVKDIYPGPYWSFLGYLTNVNGTLLFVRPDAAELWKSDGTEAGTVMVRRFHRHEDYEDSMLFPPAAVNGTLFFVADDGTHGYELWKSDGTPQGTVMVKDIHPGLYGAFAPNWLDDEAPAFTNVNGTLFFRASDGTAGDALWKSDGTAAGTVMVKDIHTGGSYATPFNFTNVNGTLYFSTAGFGAGDGSIWKSDGTEAGTVRVKAFESSLASPVLLTNVNGVLYFEVDDGVHGMEVWRSDGTEAGTVLVKDVNPDSTLASWGQRPTDLTNVEGTLYFVAFDGVHGRELWKSDGTEAGTVLAADLNPGVLDSSPAALTATAAGLYFVADDGVAGRELFGLTSPRITNDDGVVIVQPGQPLTYRIAITNPGGPRLAGAAVTSDFSSALQGVAWTCVSSRGAVCAASGAGDIDDTVDLPGGSHVTYLATGTIAPTATGTLSSTATLLLPGNLGSPSATDVDVVQAARNFFTLIPCRLVDTRTTLGGQAVSGGETRVFVARDRCGIPATATAIAVNVTALRSGAPGHVRTFPAGQALPTISIVNYQPGQIRGSNTIVALNANGEFSAYASQGSGTTVDLVVDVTGYFE